MKAFKEQIQMPSGQSFRLIRWAENLREVESVKPGGTVEGGQR